MMAFKFHPIFEDDVIGCVQIPPNFCECFEHFKSNNWLVSSTIGRHAMCD